MVKTKQKNSRNNYYSHWKNIMEIYFADFMNYFFPKSSAAIDWTVVPEFLNTELSKILSRTRDKRLYADKLAKVHRKNGTMGILFIHIEIQASPDPNFAYRMLQYNTRIRERFVSENRFAVTSLAVLADDNPNWRPSSYVQQTEDTKLQFEFATVKLLDMEIGNEELLQKGKNPFVWIVRAHLDSLATRKSDSHRFQRKKEIVRLLYQSGFTKDVVREVLVFFEWILHLPEEYSEPFELYLEELESNMGREFLPSWERRAMQQGRQEGRQEGREEGRQEVREELEQKIVGKISRVLEKRLNGGSQPYIASISHLSEGERDELFDLLIDTTETEKIKAWFAAHPVKKTSGN
jgi:flagellar biosynthesis/type III secretory pathway protein FliH